MPDPLPAPPPATQATQATPTKPVAPARPTPAAHPAPRTYDPLAALLSFLLPGLGQVLQGRVGKGVMFFACLYTLFFYGFWMGGARNVWLADPATLPPATLPDGSELSGTPKALYHRPQFLLQAGIGVAAWPAVAQYVAADPDAAPDAPPPIGLLGNYMRAPTETQLNDLQRGRDTTFDLGWVFTVIAGALNLLVIYDALAGPVVRSDEEYPPRPAPKAPATKGGAA